MGIAAVPNYVLYGEAISDRFPDGLHIETIHSRSSIHDWRIRPHRHHDLHQVFWIAAGGGTASIEGVRQDFGPATLMVIPPLAIHGFRFEPGTEGLVVSVPTALVDAVRAGLSDAGRVLDQPSVSSGRTDPAAAALAATLPLALEEYGSAGPGRRAALTALASLIVVQAARVVHAAEPRDSATGSDRRADLVRRFVRLVEERYREQIPLSSYADVLGVSVPHLTRVCRELLGLPARAVVHDRLVLEARRNLVYTSMTVSQVAFRLGFSDPAYFSRFFAERVGMSPSGYRAGVFSVAGDDPFAEEIALPDPVVAFAAGPRGAGTWDEGL